MRLFLSLILFSFYFSFSYSQGLNTDSLSTLLKKASSDTTRMRLRIAIGENVPIFRFGFWDTLQTDCNKAIYNGNPDTKSRYYLIRYRSNALNNIGYIFDGEGNSEKAINYYEQALKLNEDNKDLESVALVLNNIGGNYLSRGNNAKALGYFQRSLAIQIKVKDKKGMSYSYINLGAIYDNLGDIPKALEFYLKSLKINEELGEKDAMAYSLNNIGTIYDNQGDYAKALDYFNQCLKLREKINDKRGMAIALNNIANVYKEQGKIKEALLQYQKSNAIQEEISDKHGLLFTQNNIGNLYQTYGDPYCSPFKSSACIEKGIRISRTYYDQALSLAKELDEKPGIANSLYNISSCLIAQNNFTEALLYAEECLKISREIGYPENIKKAAFNLKQIYQHNHQPDKALEMYELYISMRDSVSSEESKKATEKQQFKYEWEKRETQIKADQEKRETIAAQEKFRQRLIIGFTAAGLLIVIGFSLSLYKRFKITQQQKHIIEEKNKEITDSIHYASRIQRAMLTSDEYINHYLKESYFIYYQPKDIVSGDFYWAVEQHNSFYIATSDCTGHGVPGAFMSLLNISFLNENVIERGISEPNEILNNQRIQIIKALNPTGTENSKDGMDCVLCRFDFTNLKLTFAAANNPVYLVRNGELTEYKADKMPVGLTGEELKDYRLQCIDLQKGDSIYTFTDGYADQFGGPKGKKFMYKKLKEVLVQNVHLPMSEQKNILYKTMEEWKNGLDQIDDILIIGVKI